MISPFHQSILAIGVARVLVRKRRERGEEEAGGGSSRKRKFEVSDDGSGEIAHTLRSLSASGVPLQFPHAVEILFDFMLFDVDTASSAGGSLLDAELGRLISSDDEDDDDDGRMHAFMAHVTRRLVQRTLGASDGKFGKALSVVRHLLCDASEATAVVAAPTAYARLVLEAVGEAVRLIGALHLNLVSNPAHFRAYERLGPLCEALTTGLLREVAWARRQQGPHGGDAPLPAEAWALSVLARSFDATSELPLVRAAYLRCIDRIETDNMRNAGSGFSY